MQNYKILYGVAGEGMGHAIRSSVIIDFLISKGVLVTIVSSGRAADFLKSKYNDVIKIDGMKISYTDNAVNKIDTIIQNSKLIKKLNKNLKLLSYELKNKNFDKIITDFESAVCFWGAVNDIPILSLDNIQSINRMKIDDKIKGINYKLAKSIVKFKTPKCKKYFITSFFNSETVKKNTFIFDPIIRENILSLKNKTTIENHILVYQTSNNCESLINKLKKEKETFIVYGVKKELTEPIYDGNIIYKGFSESNFINDLISSKAVVSGGSFTTMSECIYLGKPMLSVPISGQFEQEMNSFYLEKLGFGKSCLSLDKIDISNFIKNLSFYNDNLNLYKHDLNKNVYENVLSFIKN